MGAQHVRIHVYNALRGWEHLHEPLQQAAADGSGFQKCARQTQKTKAKQHSASRRAATRKTSKRSSVVYMLNQVPQLQAREANRKAAHGTIAWQYTLPCSSAGAEQVQCSQGDPAGEGGVLVWKPVWSR